MAGPAPLFRGPAHAVDDTRPEIATLVGADFSALSITPQEACDAPRAVRAALARFAPWDAARDIDLRPFAVTDLGDAGARHLVWPEAYAALRRLAVTAGERGAFVIALGGDHSVSWPLVSAAASGRRIGLIQLDAHHDVRPLDDGPSNGTPIRGLLEDGIVRGEDVVQIGIHPFANHPDLGAYCAASGITTVPVEQVCAREPERVVADALAALADCELLYLTVDIDVLDRAFAPGTVGALAGGIDPRRLLALVQGFCDDPRVQAMDVVEFDPARDVGEITARAVAAVVMVAVASVAARRGGEQ